MWLGNFLSRAARLGYNIILRDNVKTLDYNAEDNIKEDSTLNKLNKNAHNDLILSQDDTVFFHIIEQLVAKYLPNGYALRSLGRLNKKFQTITGESKTRLCNKFAKI